MKRSVWQQTIKSPRTAVAVGFLVGFCFIAQSGLSASTRTSGPPQPCCSLTIRVSAPKTVFKTGSPVPLTITLTNVSPHDAFYIVTNKPGGGLLTVVYDSGGKLAPDTAYGRTVHPWIRPVGPPVKGPATRGYIAQAGSYFGFKVPLAPGERKIIASDATKEYDLSRPGKYTIQVEMSDPESTATIKSNTITITVTPK